MATPFDESEGLDRVPFTLSSPGEMARYTATLSPERQEALEIEMAQRQAIIKLQRKRQAAELEKKRGQEQKIALDEEGSKGVKGTHLPRNPLPSPNFAASGSQTSYSLEATTRTKSPTPPSESVPEDTADWIETENGLYFNAKELEDNAMALCGHLISECIVVGTGRPSPVMFIKPGKEMDQDKLKKEILRKTQSFYARRYLHERISNPGMIVIIPKLVLPQSDIRGNLRREFIEKEFKSEIDQIFALKV